MTKNILILGSNSFAGSNFANFCLNQNFKVYGVSRSKENEKFLEYKNNSKKKNYVFLKKDINNIQDQNYIVSLIKRKKIKIIVNFIAQGMVEESWLSPEDWYQTNLLAQVNLIKKIQKIEKIKKFINFSTPEVYGSTKNLIKENFDFNPSTPYALSRSAFDLHLKLLFENQNFPVIITRTANIFGPYQQLYRIVPKAIMYFMLNKKINLHGGGHSIRSFIYMDDVSEALIKIINKGKIGKTYHISTSEFITIKKLVQIINNKFKHKKLINYKIKDRLGKDYAYKLNSNKLINELGWKPNTKLDDGINKTINWIMKNFNQFKKMQTEYKHKK